MVWITFCVMRIVQVSGVRSGNLQIGSQVAIEAEDCSESLEFGPFQGAATLFGFAAPTPSNASRNCAAEGKRSFGFFSSRRLIRG
jgi:hypothetical protein